LFRECSPVNILKRQGRFLDARTKGIVTVSVIMETSSVSEQKVTSSDTFRYSFYLVAPALNDYRYRLFSVEYNTDFYPLVIELESALCKEINPGLKRLEREI